MPVANLVKRIEADGDKCNALASPSLNDLELECKREVCPVSGVSYRTWEGANCCHSPFLYLEFLTSNSYIIIRLMRIARVG